MVSNNSEIPLKFSIKEKTVFLLLVILSLFSPLIFKWVAINNFFSLDKDTALIGESIGGISAPFIGLLAAFLVYKSFEAQISANYSQMDIIRQELSFNFISTLTQEITIRFDRLEIYDLISGELLMGKDSINHLHVYLEKISLSLKDDNKPGAEILESYFCPYLLNLTKYLKSITMLKSRIDKSNLPQEIKIIKIEMLNDFVSNILSFGIDKLKIINTDFIKEPTTKQLEELFNIYEHSINI